MANDYLKRLRLPVALLVASGLAAFAGAPAKQDESKAQELPVKWTQEFDMPSLLDQAPGVNRAEYRIEGG